MGSSSWRSVVGDAEISDEFAKLFDELESYGWYARSRWGDTGVRFWPEGGRAKQIVVDLALDLNQYRRETILDAIKTYTAARQKEGGTK